MKKYRNSASILVTRYWPLILVGWLALALLLHWAAPTWDSIAQDGDLAFLPKNVPSLVGQDLLDRGFPNHRVRSQVVVVIARPATTIETVDLAVGLDVGRKLQHSLARAIWNRASRELDPEKRRAKLLDAKIALDQAIALDDELFLLLGSDSKLSQATLPLDRFALAYWDRAAVATELGELEQAADDRETAQLIIPDIEQQLTDSPTADDATSSLVDVWTWQDQVMGHKLGARHPHARLIVLQLDSEFIATGNIDLVEEIEKKVADSRKGFADYVPAGLQIEISGSAAIGGDMRRAAVESVRQTEWVTLLLILIILTVVYRGPLLVAIPIVTIGISLWVSTGIVALLAKPIEPTLGASWGLQVFTTTKIFVVVLLFGAGTDFCLFFLARCREELQSHPLANRRGMQRMIARSWRGVHDALLASALTTIIGLGLMCFSQFDKFKSTGPIIGLCLAVTLVTCLTFTPAIVCAIGPVAFWPLLRRLPMSSEKRADVDPWWMKFWAKSADMVTTYPRATLVGCLIVLGIPAISGWNQQGFVTYDFAGELSDQAPSRRGASLIAKYFPSADSSPVSVVLVKREPFSDVALSAQACQTLADKLYVDGVEGVRSLADPLGDYPPGRTMGLFSKDAWRRRVLQSHRYAREYFVSQSDGLQQKLARFDVVLTDNPFSLPAAAVLENLKRVVEKETNDPKSPWYLADFAYTGTTAGIVDLRQVTQSDQTRIQWLVALGVWGVLVLILRRPWLSGYLILSVLLSYLTTLGLTHWVFSFLYAERFDGLDWKVPLFLFVILVAVGQDYNVYLTTRVLEEQQRLGLIAGVRRGMIVTGGIITSCGIVMAGTFLSMTSGAISQWMAELGWWTLPEHQQGMVLRGMVELGFALTLGVLIDTMVVRSVLVPCILTIMARRQETATIAK